MNRESLLRLLLITDGGQAETFAKNLFKIITLVLFNTGSNITKLCADQIRENLICKYNLEFTNEEIENTIRKKNKGDILSVEEKTEVKIEGIIKKEKRILFYLSTKALDKLDKKEKNNNIINLLNIYIETNKLEFKIEDAYNLIIKYLYYVFNFNLNELNLLISGGEESTIINLDDGQFSNVEKEFINGFIKWDNNEKNRMVYSLISFCIDYCMLTVKKDNNLLANIFRGKVFYLDANVIFRLLGINNEDRKKVTNSFIKKSKSAGIKIKYTNFTYEEIENTIDYNVDRIKEILNNKAPLKPQYYHRFSHPYTNLSFLDKYYFWYYNKQSSKDFSSFRKHLKKEVKEILKEFDQDSNCITYEVTRKKQFEQLYQSLYEFKTNRSAKNGKETITVDVNNYIHVLQKRRDNRGNSFYDINNYFISTDSKLCEWSKSIMPKGVQIVLLPSVWHSILLKFKGRTNDDFKSFSTFLTLRYNHSDIEYDKRRINILREIQDSEHTNEMKELILDEIDEKLRGNEYNDDDDFDQIIKQTENNILEEVRVTAFTEGQALSSDEINRVKNEAIKREDDIRKETIESTFENIAQKKVDIRKKLLGSINYLRILFGLVLVFVLLYNSINEKWEEFFSKFINNNLGFDFTHWMSIISMVLLAISFLLIKPAYSIFFCKGNDEDLKSRIKKKLVRKYSH